MVFMCMQLACRSRYRRSLYQRLPLGAMVSRACHCQTLDPKRSSDADRRDGGKRALCCCDIVTKKETVFIHPELEHRGLPRWPTWTLSRVRPHRFTSPAHPTKQQTITTAESSVATMNTIRDTKMSSWEASPSTRPRGKPPIHFRSSHYRIPP